MCIRSLPLIPILTFPVIQPKSNKTKSIRSSEIIKIYLAKVYNTQNGITGNYPWVLEGEKLEWLIKDRKRVVAISGEMTIRV